MSYDKAKTFDRAEQEMDKKIQEKEKAGRSEEEKKKPKKSKEMLYGNLFRNQRKEIMYFIMNDGSVINVTSKQENSIKGEIDVKVGDIKTVVHNHLRVKRFSRTDKDFYSSLLGKGFKGKFLLFCKGVTYSLDKGDLGKQKEKKKLKNKEKKDEKKQ